MTINVNTNVSAMTAQRYLTKATGELNTSMERLSSGNRINSAKMTRQACRFQTV